MNVFKKLFETAGKGVNPLGSVLSDKFDKDHQWTPNPEALSGAFKSRDGKPALQSSARNIGHALFGEKIGNYVDQHALGDIPAQKPNVNTFSTLMTNGTVPVDQTPGALTPVQPQLNAAPQQKANTGKDLLDVLQALSSAQGGM